MKNKPYFPPGTPHGDEYFTINGLDFIWDKAKNERNLKVRGFDFRTAALVFNDEYCIFNPDPLHSDGEERESVIGYPIMDKNSFDGTVIGSIDDLLFVVFTERISSNGEDYYRIISARFATKKEEDRYMKNRLNSL